MADNLSDLFLFGNVLHGRHVLRSSGCPCAYMLILLMPLLLPTLLFSPSIFPSIHLWASCDTVQISLVSLKLLLKNRNNSQNETGAENGQTRIKYQWEPQYQVSQHRRCCGDSLHYHTSVMSVPFPSPWIQLKVNTRNKVESIKKPQKRLEIKPIATSWTWTEVTPPASPCFTLGLSCSW